MTATNSFIQRIGGGAIIETVDEILSRNPNAAGLAVNWHCFGSNNLETADYNSGVLERFTRRAKSDWTPDGMGNAHVKTIANPRKISHMTIPHFAFYFEGTQAVNENGKAVSSAFNNPVTAEKIVINHYSLKSREEYIKKVSRGRADTATVEYEMKNFDSFDRNDEFDDGILKYRDERAKIYQPPDKSHADERLLNALVKNLSPTLFADTPPNFCAGKMETFLTCRAVADYLKTRLTDDTLAKFFEEAALKAIQESFNGASFADVRLLLSELPSLLSLPYSCVKDLRGACLQIIPQMMNVLRMNSLWREFVELDYLQRLIKNFEE